MKVAVTGSTGLIGSALTPFLTSQGYSVARLVRSGGEGETSAQNIQWQPESGFLDERQLEGMDAVVHLAGENVAGYWTAAKKERIRSSRVNSTRLLCQSLASLTRRPRVLVSASAIGYYGSRGDEVLREDSPPGSGFLPEVCQAWESATEPARDVGIRVVVLRLGIVLSPRGGALSQMLLPFRMGLAAESEAGSSTGVGSLWEIR